MRSSSPENGAHRDHRDDSDEREIIVIVIDAQLLSPDATAATPRRHAVGRRGCEQRANGRVRVAPTRRVRALRDELERSRFRVESDRRARRGAGVVEEVEGGHESEGLAVARVCATEKESLTPAELGSAQTRPPAARVATLRVTRSKLPRSNQARNGNGAGG